jgi:MoxR-like ATPase
VVAQKQLQGLPQDVINEHEKPLVSQAERLVDFHGKFKALVQSKNFGELRSYASVSIRELLQVLEHLRHLIRAAPESLLGLSASGAAEARRTYAFEVWCTYGSRFRERQSREAVQELITEFWGNFTPSSSQQALTVSTKHGVQLGKVHLPFNGYILPEWRMVTEPEVKALDIPLGDRRVDVREVLPLNALEIERLLGGINQCHVILSSAAFVEAYGVYIGARQWWVTWVSLIVASSKAGHALQPTQLAALGVCAYAPRLRHERARDEILACLSKVYGVDSTAVQRAMATVSPRALIKRDILPERPIALTQRLRGLWVQLMRSLRIQLPMLVVGGTGCGKSAAVMALGELLHCNCWQAYLTPETDASFLVGSFRPSCKQDAAQESASAGSPMIDWQDGVITEAIKGGGWVLLDNFNDADPCILERLNPLLEQDAHWALTEKGETSKMDIPSTFRVLATMTVGVTGSTQKAELSPALSNRFTTIFMPSLGVSANSKGAETMESREEFAVLAMALLGMERAPADKVARFCVRICELLLPAAGAGKNYSLVEPLTFRSLVRLLDTAYRLKQAVKGASWGSCLLSAFEFTIAGQFKRGADAGDIKTELHQLLTELFQEQPEEGILKFESPRDETHVLTAQRMVYAKRLHAAVVSNFPVLLEGPAAVGKTSLVQMLASQGGGKLERVNNTQTTTIQDYLGSFVPVGSRFVFQPGALYRAVENGDWFLADEFNLADPSVMSMLAPLLEGSTSILIPGTNFSVAVHPNFRFFATQNDAAKYQGRNQLPATLRSRLVEVQIEDFAPAKAKQPQTAELYEILMKRQISPGETGMQPEVAAIMASVYELVNAIEGTDVRLTMRELIKWGRRKHGFFGGKRADPNEEKNAWYNTGISLLYPRAAPGTTALERLSGSLAKAFELTQPRGEPEPEFISTSTPPVMRLGDIRIPIQGASGMSVAAEVNSMPKSFQRCLARVLVAASRNEPILLTGPTSCKSYVISAWLRMVNREKEAEVCFLSPESEASDLIGQMHPYTPLSALKEVQNTFDRMLTRLQLTPSSRSGQLDSAYDVLKTLGEAIEKYRDASNLAAEAGAADEPLDIPLPMEADSDARSPAASDSGSERGDIDDFEASRIENEFAAAFDAPAEISMEIDGGFYQFGGSADQDADDLGSPSHSPVFDGYGSRSSSDSRSSRVSVESRRSASSIRSRSSRASSASPEPQALDEAPMPGAVDATIDQADAQSGNESSGSDDLFEAWMKPNPNAAAKPSLEDLSDDEQTLPSRKSSLGSRSSRANSTSSSTSSTTEGSLSSRSSDGAPVHGLSEGAEAEPTPSRPGEGLRLIKQALAELKEQYANEEDSKQLREVLQKIGLMRDTVRSLLRQGADPVVSQLLIRVSQFTTYLEGCVSGKSDPMFAFREGPITRAAIQGGVVVLEDFNLPSQAVTERLNSLFEPDRSFSLTEDISRSRGDLSRWEAELQNAAGQNIDIPPRMQIFATVHRDNPNAALRISPATRSRFTEICVPAYGNDETRQLLEVVMRRLPHDQHGEVKVIAGHLVGLKNCMDEFTNGTNDVTLLQLLKVCDYIVADPAGGLLRRMLVGVRFLILDSFRPDAALKRAQEWNEQCRLKADEVLAGLFSEPTEHQEEAPLELVGNDKVRCVYGAVSEPLLEPAETLQELKNRFRLHFTKTSIKNISRIFVSGAAKAPLLMQGPPGIGKTAIVMAVAGIVGAKVARINFSANTSIDQLYGSIVPCVIDGKRVFKWQDGKLLSAVRNGEWLLLDEVNLAPPEVLEGLVPLLRRDASELHVPGTDIKESLRNVRVFATMNPVSTGGGRNKLPRSIESLFTTVSLDGYGHVETFEILKRCFVKLLEVPNSSDKTWGALTYGQLTQLYELHCEFGRLVASRDLGRVGGPFEFNLRDLMKLKDVLAGNADNFRDHYRFYNKSVDQLEADVKNRAGDATHNDSDIRTLALQKFALLVYAARFQCQEDRDKAESLITENYLKVEAELKDMVRDEIDASLPGLIRIGTVYLETGSETEQSGVRLVHTARTISQLEALAAAVQARRPVLLEGDTCSGKTALVREIAHLCKRKLTVMSLTHETETSDLIGQWLPMKPEAQEAFEMHKIGDFLSSTSRSLLILYLPFISVQSQRPTVTSESYKMIATRVEKSISSALGAAGVAGLVGSDANSKEHIREILAAVSEVKETLEALQSLSELPRSLVIMAINLSNRADRMKCTLRSMSVHAGKESSVGMAFTFVESPLLRAIREGEWVLLDNVNSAPPEVIERLNSLFEDEPTLNLIELGDGESLTAENGIHMEFRIFSTSNTNRKNSHRLSGAFLNRVLRIWLPPLDATLVSSKAPQDLQKHDVFDIVCARLPDAPGKAKLAEFILRLHQEALRLSRAKEIALVGDIQMTFRTVLRTLRTAQLLMAAPQEMEPLKALVWSALRNYADCCKDRSGREKIIIYIKDLLGEPRIRNAMMPDSFVIQGSRSHLGAESWKAELGRLTLNMANLETCGLRLLAACAVDLGPEKGCQVAEMMVQAGLNLEADHAKVEAALEKARDCTAAGEWHQIFQVMKLLPVDAASTLSDLQARTHLQEASLVVLKKAVDVCSTAIQFFTDNASFLDVRHREQALRRVTEVRSRFLRLLRHESWVDVGSGTSVRKARGLLESMTTLDDGLLSLSILMDGQLQQAYKELEAAFASKKSILSIVKRDLNAPLHRSKHVLFRVLDTFVLECEDQKLKLALQTFGVALYWATHSTDGIAQLKSLRVETEVDDVEERLKVADLYKLEVKANLVQLRKAFMESKVLSRLPEPQAVSELNYLGEKIAEAKEAAGQKNARYEEKLQAIESNRRTMQGHLADLEAQGVSIDLGRPRVDIESDPKLTEEQKFTLSKVFTVKMLVETKEKEASTTQLVALREAQQKLQELEESWTRENKKWSQRVEDAKDAVLDVFHKDDAWQSVRRCFQMKATARISAVLNAWHQMEPTKKQLFRESQGVAHVMPTCEAAKLFQLLPLEARRTDLCKIFAFLAFSESSYAVGGSLAPLMINISLTRPSELTPLLLDMQTPTVFFLHTVVGDETFPVTTLVARNARKLGGVQEIELFHLLCDNASQRCPSHKLFVERLVLQLRNASSRHNVACSESLLADKFADDNQAAESICMALTGLQLGHTYGCDRRLVPEETSTAILRLLDVNSGPLSTSRVRASREPSDIMDGKELASFVRCYDLVASGPTDLPEEWDCCMEGLKHFHAELRQRVANLDMIKSELEKMLPNSLIQRAHLLEELETITNPGLLAFVLPIAKQLLTIKEQQEQMQRTRAALDAVSALRRLCAFVPRFVFAAVSQSSEEVIRLYAIKNRVGDKMAFGVYKKARLALTTTDVKHTLCVSKRHGAKLFRDLQKDLSEVLEELRVGTDLGQRHHLLGIFDSIADKLPDAEHREEVKTSGLPEEHNLTYLDNKVIELRKRVETEVTKARKLSPRPLNIINAMNLLLRELQKGVVSQTDYRRLEGQANLWFQRVKEYEASMKRQDPLLKKLPTELQKLQEVAELIRTRGAELQKWVGAMQQEGGHTRRELESELQSLLPEQGDVMDDHKFDRMRLLLDNKIEYDYTAELMTLLDGAGCKPQLEPGPIIEYDEEKAARLRICTAILQLEALPLDSLFMAKAPNTAIVAVERDAVMRLSAKRLEDLGSDDFRVLFADLAVLQDSYRIWEPRKDDVDDVFVSQVGKVTLFDAFGRLQGMYKRRERLEDITLSGEINSALQPRLVGLRLADLALLGAPHYPEAVAKLIRIEHAADKALVAMMEGGDGHELMEVETRAADFFGPRCPMHTLPDALTGSPEEESKFNDELHQVIVEARVTLAYCLHGIETGTTTEGEVKEAAQKAVFIKAAGISDYVSQWLPMQGFLAASIAHIAKELRRQICKEGRLEDNHLRVTADLQVEIDCACDEHIERQRELQENARPTDHLRCQHAAAEAQKRLQELTASVKTKKAKALQETYDILARETEGLMRALGAMISCIGQVDAEEQLPDLEACRSVFVRLSRGSKECSGQLGVFNERVSSKAEQVRTVMRSRLVDNTVVTRRIEHFLLLCEVAQCSSLNIARSATVAASAYSVAPITQAYMREVVESHRKLVELVTYVSKEASKDVADTHALLEWLKDIRELSQQLPQCLKAFADDPNRLRQAPTAVKALQKLTFSFLDHVYRSTFASLRRVQIRQLPGGAFDTTLESWRDDLCRNKGFKASDLGHEGAFESLTRQRSSIRNMLRGSFMYAAFGIASTPFEVIQSCEAAIASFDPNMLAPTYVAGLLNDYGLKQLVQLMPKVDISHAPQPSERVVKVLRVLTTGASQLTLFSSKASKTTGTSGCHRDGQSALNAYEKEEVQMEKAIGLVNSLTETFMPAVEEFVARITQRSNTQQEHQQFASSFSDLVTSLARELLASSTYNLRDSLLTNVAKCDFIERRLCHEQELILADPSPR